ncbi:MAG: hypothetical protein R3B09_11685 [Nannocystaceae bacterium]
MDPRGPRGVVFLLSLGAIPLACDKDDSGASAGATDGSATANVSTSSTGTDGSGSGTGSTTSSTTSSTTDDTATGGMSATGTTGDPEDPCYSYWAKQAECHGFTVEEYVGTYLEDCRRLLTVYAEFYGQACADTYASFFTCMGALSCASIDEYPSPCAPILDALSDVCVLILSPTCVAFGDKAASCDPQKTAAEVAHACEEELFLDTLAYGDACAETAEEYFACLSGLSCPELELDVACDGISTCDDPAAPTSSK